MKKSSKELKRLAREQLNGRYSVPMGAFVIASLIPALIEIPFSMTSGNLGFSIQTVIFLLAEYLITLIGLVLNMGVVRIHLNLTRGMEFKLIQLFDPFRYGADRFFGGAVIASLFSIAANIPVTCGLTSFYQNGVSAASVLTLIVTSLVSLVLALLVALSYQFASYFLLDYPAMKVTAAFRECRRLMRGNRGRFFYLMLSFIGWECLVLCSLGIASLWVNPYITQTYTNFFLDTTGELDRIPPRHYVNVTAGYENEMY
jgi:uncharacterized membrane protein